MNAHTIAQIPFTTTGTSVTCTCGWTSAFHTDARTGSADASLKAAQRDHKAHGRRAVRTAA